MRVLAIDWSGKLKRAEEFLWLADVHDGKLVDLRNGLTREQLISRVIETAKEGPEIVVGFDFAFSFPRWWCTERGWTKAQNVWGAMAQEGEELLATCQDPLWGRPGRPNPHPANRLYRRTDRDAGVGAAKSVFQIGGAGAVGTGSIRGMPHLLTLAENGLSVWPFTVDGGPSVVEIYPRALTGPVRKSSWRERHNLLFDRFPDQAVALLERAAGSEDAFDAAVSALVMSSRHAELRTLARPSGSDYEIEGKIWRPA